jgi:hydrogenase maturation protein HypF
VAVVAGRRRVRVRVEGVVQGVGFRPHVYRLARELGLAGWVRNDERGVVIEVEGEGGAVERFVRRVGAEAPPLAAVERVTSADAPATGEDGFEVVASGSSGAPAALVAADTATCEACLAEVLDPADRRHRYPFTNCTHCGPRFTIVLGVPYDRERTTMRGFAMCPACRAEYEDPADRRFHAQPNACPACGPSLRLADAAGRASDRDDALRAAAEALRDGAIVAVKGVGGFHLACLAADEAAVAALRARKHREDKPFALMAADLDAARELVELGPEDEALLLGRERPIVLAPRRADAPVGEAAAPRSGELGVMLPYSPLHHLLVGDVGQTLVMTSANVSDEPIAYEDADALARLGAIADRFLVHDRPIHMRTDDSVARVVRGRAMLLRRSRGHVPGGMDLPVETPRPLLACGAELKSTFCVAKGSRAWVSHHIGDLATWETLRSFREGIDHFEALFAVEPEVVVHDLHPGYLSTAYALERGVRALGVQHHHAHLAGCLAEHGERGDAVGAIFDGTGYGPDGTIWGGELLAGGLGGAERAGHLWPVPMPGGEEAIREPWRMARAWLLAAAAPAPALAARVERALGPRRWAAVGELAAPGVASPVTSSMGRLFDAVAALCGGPLRVTYEGQAAVELEALAAGAVGTAAREPYALELADDLVLDPRPTVAAVAADLAAGVPAATVAARFHETIARATAGACARVAAARGLGTAVLSGGVFQNRLLLARTGDLLDRAGLRVLHPERLPANDGGIAYGQAAVAAAWLSAEDG